MIRVAFALDINLNSESPNYNLWKYLVLENIYNVTKHVNNVKEIVMAMDGPNSWRKLVFPPYKETRKDSRKKSDIDWDEFYKILNSYQQELKENVPIKVIKLNKVEADDIIATIVNKSNFDEYHIVSTDLDFTQLIRDNVRVYNPNKKEYMKSNPDFVLESCFTGQSKDNIYNIKTPIDYPIDKRKPGFGKKSFEKIKNNWREWLKENELEKRFEINKKLIDFNEIPQVILDRIMKEYNEYDLPEIKKLYPFFDGYGWTYFIENYKYVEQKFLEMY